MKPTKEMIEAGYAVARVRDIRDDRASMDRFADGLTAALAAMPAPEVKPLQWIRLSNGMHLAKTPIGRYYIVTGNAVRFGMKLIHEGGISGDVAAAAAQADYEARTWVAVKSIMGLAAENERLRAALEFVQQWAWRDDPPNAAQNLSDKERLSAIKYHPSILPGRAALERKP